MKTKKLYKGAYSFKNSYKIEGIISLSEPDNKWEVCDPSGTPISGVDRFKQKRDAVEYAANLKAPSSSAFRCTRCKTVNPVDPDDKNEDGDILLNCIKCDLEVVAVPIFRK